MGKVTVREVKAAGLENLFFPWWRDAVWSDSASGYAERDEKIRQLYATGDWTQEALGSLFYLNPSRISQIVNR